jgi:type IV fimbrial biogenesis protein FimT
MRVMRGFTLIELVVVIAILCIFVTMAVPGFSRLIARENRADTTLELAHALNFARARAISTRHDVAVCKSRSGTQCGDESEAWSDGWIVFMNPDGNWSVDPGEQIVLRHGQVDDAVTVSGNRDAFNFRPTSIRSTAGSLFVCGGKRQHGKAVIVSVTGRVRTASKKADGSAIACNH